MLVLGIETSCDETAAAIVSSEREILSNIVLSQTDDHAAFGGVVPEIAARAHAHHLDSIIREALSVAGKDLTQIDAVAATGGPGLIGGVIVGVLTAKAIAAVHQKPFVAVNHLEGHALTARLTNDVQFPYLLLLVSGGHCQLLAVEGVGKYTKLGGTMDDALGEAFDKTAKLLGLGFPGGPALEKTALDGDPHRYDFVIPLKGRQDSNFSFSGFKTSIRTEVVKLAEKGEVTPQMKADLCASFQRCVGDILHERLQWGIRQFKERWPDGAAMVVAGGVAANTYLRGRLSDISAAHELFLVVPPARLCTDNAAMIAWAGLEHFLLGNVSSLDFNPRPRWPLDEKAA